MELTFTHEYKIYDKNIKETHKINNQSVSEEGYHKLLSDYTDNILYEKPLNDLDIKAMIKQSYDLKDIVKHIRSLKINDAVKFLLYLLEEEFSYGYSSSTVETLRNNANLLNQIANDVESYVYKDE